ncbi:MAG TPA: hypothetical protein DD724_06360 [Lactobacillus acetotolerans]|nr:hypothetical protein [Lactobacillus acetotolerans]
MKPFEKYSDYMYYLLHAPFKKIRKEINQWYILFKVLGKYFDKAKEFLFLAREAVSIISAPEELLLLHGMDRDMIRLKGESIEDYRYRLLMKMEIAKQAGIVPGILLAAKALGYDETVHEPLYLTDENRWDEFNLYLAGSYISNVNELSIISEEINKVKQASSKANLIFLTPNIGNIRVGIAKVDGGIITNRQVI